MEQPVDYEWLPTKCASCKKLGHTAASCKHAPDVVKRMKEPQTQSSKDLITAGGIDTAIPGTPSMFCKNNRRTRLIQTFHMILMEFCNILSWNVRGMNKKNRQMAVLEVCRLNKIGIGALIETKTKGNKINDVMTSTFVGWNFYSSSILEGRILLIWKANLVKIDILQESDQLLHSRVRLLGRNHDFCLSIVYGSNNLETRKLLWSDLSTVQRPIKPWILLGDFNVVFNMDDRLGGRPISVKEMEDAHQWLALGMATEMKTLGPAYTWSNKQDGGARIFSKLDRVFTNENWSDTFPLASAFS
ncbi:uncharacterized protein LOC133800158 [Humulus lupulus]|uniref:uncharacterized protein LOC133800158 n=1 Tax=Humulus lupulus TaxID=3486 RepID=UPI002B406FF2|nr:uncharacterized protein LOC133800158 [Humulus lupulus]